MDHNDILKAEREGRLSEYSLADLKEMRKICARHLQNRNDFMVHPCGSVENEIHRKEAEGSEQREQQRHHELISSEEHRKSSSDDRWFRKPVGIVVLSVAAGLLLLLIKFKLGL